MDVSVWLEGLDLGEYSPTFSENEIDADTLPTLTADDLKELGVTKLGHRKKMLAAIEALKGGASPAEVPSTPEHSLSTASPMVPLAESWPLVVALPLKEYAEEDHPGMKLWAACDTVELLLRFLVTVSSTTRS